MRPQPAELTSLKDALARFASPDPGQSSEHLRSLRWYVACRLVIEGGFDPDWIRPRPPITVEKTEHGSFLHHDPNAAKPGRRPILGGLKAGKPDVTVTIPTIGPVLALSLKGTRHAFGDLTDTLEETAGACTNLHMVYPALVYGFWHVLRANEADDPAPMAHFRLRDGRYDGRDLALLSDGELAAPVQRYGHALKRLSERGDLRDAPSRYEACGLTLANCRGGPEECGVNAGYPVPGSEFDYNRMFQRLYAIYDRRVVDSTRALRGATARKVWHRESPLLADTVSRDDAFAEMEPRVGWGRGVCPPFRPASGEQSGYRDGETASRTRDEIVARLDERHRTFFREMAIDPRTGIPGCFPDSGKRFACHPYVGTRYGESTRILFIGLDIGSDPGHLQSFETRRRHIEDKRLRDHNPHIAGTWCAALSLLPPEYGWGEIADSELSCQRVLRRYPEARWKANPLSFVGLTNFYKWATIRRDRASGGQDRSHLESEIERRFVMDEIRLYEPQVVVFQGAGFRNRPHLEFVERLSREFEVRVLMHPSMRGKRRPRDVVEALWTSRR